MLKVVATALVLMAGAAVATEAPPKASPTAPSQNRPQTPKPPFPYRQVEVSYDNPAQPGIHLAGTLTLPTGRGPFPAVVLITGSGAQDRDETIRGHKPFLVLSDALTRRGVAVLRVDDRGVGGSSGVNDASTTADFVTDVQAGVNFLRARPEIDPRRVGLLGHSEGGAIAPIVAAADPRIAFVVLMAGYALPGADVTAEQARYQALGRGENAAVAQRSVENRLALLRVVGSKADEATVRQAFVDFAKAQGIDPVSPELVAQYLSPWRRYYFGLDAAPAFRRLRMPVLALLADKDHSVSSAQNEGPLRAALADDRQATIVVLANHNHMFQRTETGVEEYGDIQETISPAALKLITDWTVEAAGVRGRH